MSYAALMVHFDARRSGIRRVRLAVDLADRFHALLIGIAGRSYLQPFLAEGPGRDAESDDGERKEMLHLLAGMEKQFYAAAGRSTKQVEWRGILDYANNLVPREARAADLVIIGRKQDPKDLYYSLDPGVTILRAGRPVLFVPDEIELLQARRVIVAWKDTRECRRAVRDGLPFLKEASEVMIVTVCEPGTGTQAKPSLDDVEFIWFATGSPSAQRRFFTLSSRRPPNSCGLPMMKEPILLLPAVMATADWASG